MKVPTLLVAPVVASRVLYRQDSGDNNKEAESMTPQDYDRQRMQSNFLESLLAVLVIGLFVLAIFGMGGELLIAMAVVIAGVLVNLYRLHHSITDYSCPSCGELPHERVDERAGRQHDPATPNCLHCGKELSE
ncbi:hypothetical protein DFO61_3225 [Ectopseudomonas oleovorans]|uniref:Uncharacterized protein n=2 Tax=Pseudomonadales TaxID=72274 RepID=A0A397MFS6_ECTOL|nr:hypothetical protein DFO61_3225 [Pseudomonas oleovorans]